MRMNRCRPQRNAGRIRVNTQIILANRYSWEMFSAFVQLFQGNQSSASEARTLSQKNKRCRSWLVSVFSKAYRRYYSIVSPVSLKCSFVTFMFPILVACGYRDSCQAQSTVFPGMRTSCDWPLNSVFPEICSFCGSSALLNS